MLSTLARYWWVIVLRGVLAIAFGLGALAWPGLTLEVLVIFFGTFAFVTGVFLLVAGIAGRRDHEEWWLLALEGALGIAVGVLTYRAPGLTAVVLVLYIAAWALVSGAFQIAAAIRLRKEIEGEFWLGLGGVLSIVFGLILMVSPGTGALALVWLIGTWAIAFGAVAILLGFKLRGSAA